MNVPVYVQFVENHVHLKFRIGISLAMKVVIHVCIASIRFTEINTSCLQTGGCYLPLGILPLC